MGSQIPELQLPLSGDPQLRRQLNVWATQVRNGVNFGQSMAPVPFAALPSGVPGMLATVSDSNTNVWGAAISGGGSNQVLAFYNGTNWTVAGK